MRELDNATLDTGPIDSESWPDAGIPPTPIVYCAASIASATSLDFAAQSAHDIDIDIDGGTNVDAELERSIFGGDSPLSSPPSSRPSSPLKPKNSSQRRNKARSRARRAEKRREERANDIEASRMPKEDILKKHVDPAEEKKAPYSAETIPCASTGYVATNEKAGGVYSLDTLLKMGFELVKWDGRQVTSLLYPSLSAQDQLRSSKPIVDSNGLVVTVLVGQPNDPTWKDAHEQAFKLLQDNASTCNFTSKCVNHRRSRFAALNFGISFGGGPQVLVEHPLTRPSLTQSCRNP